MNKSFDSAKTIAVVGSGIAGLSAAWLLSQRHHVTVFESEWRLGGHSNTVVLPEALGGALVDTGFIVFNGQTYPNLVALFAHLGVETVETDMSFAVSIDNGAFEYAGGSWGGLFAQPSNILSLRFWRMLREIIRFYRDAPRWTQDASDMTLDELLDRHKFSRALREDHLYPMAAAIWSTPSLDIGKQPAAAFIRFCDNHGLLKLTNRPIWRTVAGGSKRYVDALRAASLAEYRCDAAVTSIVRAPDGVTVNTARGAPQRFDAVVIATHSGDALRLLQQPTQNERALLGAITYAPNDTWLHCDPALMPKRRAAWSSWNYLARQRAGESMLTATYWMNRLQNVSSSRPIFVSLNPHAPPRPECVVARFSYEHPQFTVAAMKAQRQLWSLQGVNRTWFCGAYFGAGFHEDGLQSGLLVAEQLGGIRRPWTVAEENGRIYSVNRELV